MSQVDELQVHKDALCEVMSRLEREKFDVAGLVSRISADVMSQAMESPASGAGAAHRSSIAQAISDARAAALRYEEERKT